jgi:hypothetical protein
MRSIQLAFVVGERSIRVKILFWPENFNDFPLKKIGKLNKRSKYKKD